MQNFRLRVVATQQKRERRPNISPSVRQINSFGLIDMKWERKKEVKKDLNILNCKYVYDLIYFLSTLPSFPFLFSQFTQLTCSQWLKYPSVIDFSDEKWKKIFKYCHETFFK
jgi:hypothetical protein